MNIWCLPKLYWLAGGTVVKLVVDRFCQTYARCFLLWLFFINCDHPQFIPPSFNISCHVYQKLLEIEKEVEHKVAWGDTKHNPAWENLRITKHKSVRCLVYMTKKETLFQIFGNVPFPCACSGRASLSHRCRGYIRFPRVARYRKSLVGVHAYGSWHFDLHISSDLRNWGIHPGRAGSCHGWSTWWKWFSSYEGYRECVCCVWRKFHGWGSRSSPTHSGHAAPSSPQCSPQIHHCHPHVSRTNALLHRYTKNPASSELVPRLWWGNLLWLFFLHLVVCVQLTEGFRVICWNRIAEKKG